MTDSNATIEFAVDGDLVELRVALMAEGVDLREIKASSPLTAPLRDGRTSV